MPHTPPEMDENGMVQEADLPWCCEPAPWFGRGRQQQATRKGAKKAVATVAHAILIIAYHLLKKEEVYEDPGANSFGHRDEDQRVGRKLWWRGSCEP